MDVIDLVKSAEGKGLAFFLDASDRDVLLRTAVAFANTSGGKIVFGIEPKQKRLIGIDEPLNLQERLLKFFGDRIHPALLPEIEVIPWRKSYLVAAKIYPSFLRPHFVKADGQNGGVYIRVGSTNRQADTFVIEEFKRLARNESFDEQPFSEASYEELDFRAASEFYEGVRNLSEADLIELKLACKQRGKMMPTVGGILLFGKRRERHFPDAWIQIARFQGSNRSTILDSAEIRSLPVKAIYEAISFIKRNTDNEIRIGSVKRSEFRTYPETAVREAIINAVTHADYSQRGAPIRVALFSDRLEIENPGFLPFGLTIPEVKRGISKLRNRVIGKVFHELKLIEQWGSGIQRMITACQGAGLRDPLLEEIGLHFRVTMFNEVGKPLITELDKVDRLILKQLSKGKGLSTQQVARFIKLSTRSARTRLLALSQKGIIIEVGTNPRDPRRLYYLRSKRTTEG